MVGMFRAAPHSALTRPRNILVTTLWFIFGEYHHLSKIRYRPSRLYDSPQNTSDQKKNFHWLICYYSDVIVCKVQKIIFESQKISHLLVCRCHFFLVLRRERDGDPCRRLWGVFGRARVRLGFRLRPVLYQELLVIRLNSSWRGDVPFHQGCFVPSLLRRIGLLVSGWRLYVWIRG